MKFCQLRVSKVIDIVYTKYFNICTEGCLKIKMPPAEPQLRDQHLKGRIEVLYKSCMGSFEGFTMLYCSFYITALQIGMEFLKENFLLPMTYE